jgi:hypothetical protein
VIKLNPEGLLEREEEIIDDNFKNAADIIQCDDGGYLLSGVKHKRNMMQAKFIDNPFGILTAGWEYLTNYKSDFSIIRNSPDGVLEWKNTYGSNGDDKLYSMFKSSDGSYYLTGSWAAVDGKSRFFVMKMEDNFTNAKEPVK